MNAPEQQDLFESYSGLTRAQLEALLNARMKRPVAVTLTRNRVTMITVDFSGAGPIRVRLHEAYLDAPRNVLQALRRYLATHRKSAWADVAQYARSIRPARAAGTRRRLRAKGAVYDLREIRDAVNKRFFQGRVSCRIGWQRIAPQRRRRRRSIRYGWYDEVNRTIRVHRALDNPNVPRRFLEYIVFHEMLHAVVPAEQRAGRVLHHTKTFRALERAFPDCHEMHRLCRALLGDAQL